MLKGTNIWTNGSMKLFVNNKPARVYVPKSNVKETYSILQSRLSKEGSIPIGIDHLPDNIIKANPILAKLDLLNVGNITKIEYTDDAIKIAEAELTNPLIKQLYDNGELDMVSIVANSTTSACPRGDYDYIINTTDITRVDIVEKGACTACNIPKPTDSSDTVVYARYAIQNEEEEKDMSDLTKEDIKAIFDESIDEKLAPMQEQINTILAREPADPTGDDGNIDDDDEKVKEMEARIADLKKESATAKVDNLIAQGKIVPAKKETMVELCASNSELFEELMKDAPVLIDLKTRKSLLASEPDDDDDPEPTPEDENVNAVLAHFSGDE